MITDLPANRISSITATATKISWRFVYKMVAKNGSHVYETKLCHCHHMYYDIILNQNSVGLFRLSFFIFTRNQSQNLRSLYGYLLKL